MGTRGREFNPLVTPELVLPWSLKYRTGAVPACVPQGGYPRCRYDHDVQVKAKTSTPLCVASQNFIAHKVFISIFCGLFSSYG